MVMDKPLMFFTIRLQIIFPSITSPETRQYSDKKNYNHFKK